LKKNSHFFFHIHRVYHIIDRRLIFKDIFKLHRLPKAIVSDRDSRFMSTLWQELFQLVGMELTPSTSYHPQTYVQTKIFNKWVEGYLKNYVVGQQRARVKWFQLGGDFYNTTHHMFISMSPFKELYGYDSLTFMEIYFGDSRAPMDKEWVQEIQYVLRDIKDHLQRAQNQ